MAEVGTRTPSWNNVPLRKSTWTRPIVASGCSAGAVPSVDRTNNFNTCTSLALIRPADDKDVRRGLLAGPDRFDGCPFFISSSVSIPFFCVIGVRLFEA